MIILILSLMAPLHAENPGLRKQLNGADLVGVELLVGSVDGKLAAGTSLHSDSTAGSGVFSKVKIWSIKDQKPVREIQLAEEVYALTFTPDGSSLITMEKKGNLGSITTLRSWNLADGTQLKLGESSGIINRFRFSPGQDLLATSAGLSHFDDPASMAQICLWPLTAGKEVLKINIANPLGEWAEVRPGPDGRIKDWIEKCHRHVIPTELEFIEGGRQLAVKTQAGDRTVLDTTSGDLVEHSGMASIGLFKTMLVVALQEAPEQAKSLSLEITPHGKPITLTKSDGDWWRMDENTGFKIQDGRFVSSVNGTQRSERVSILLGLKNGTDSSKLQSLKHPAGVITLSRVPTGIQFQLGDESEKPGPKNVLQEGRVKWGAAPEAE